MERDRGGRPRYPGIITPAEQRVLDELRKGGTNAEIAVRLGIGPETVKTHIGNMLEKLDLADRRELAAWSPGREPVWRRLRVLLTSPLALASLGRPLVWAGVGLVVVVGLIALLLTVTALRDGHDTVPLPAGTPAVSPTPNGAGGTESPGKASPTTVTASPTPTSTPLAATGPGTSSVTVGERHSCLLTEKGAVLCWGENTDGETEVPEGTYRAVSAGRKYTCAIRASGEVVCWGDNRHGQAASQLHSDYSFVTAGWNHTCAVLEEGYAHCWGSNEYGQTGLPPGEYAAVSAGAFHTCAIRDSREVLCVGFNEHGQADAPPGAFRAVYAGYSHSCGIRESGEIACWGAGYGDEGRFVVPPGRYRALSGTCAVSEAGELRCWRADGRLPSGTFRAVGMYRDLWGEGSACAVRESGGVACWTLADYGQAQPPDGRYRSMDAGYDHMCAVRQSGEVVCWGRNDSGQADAPDGSYRSVSAGFFHSCALQENGEAICWGRNDEGQTDVPPGRYRSVVAGAEHSCGLLDDGDLVCWGPYPLSLSASRYRSVSLGGASTCGLFEDGEVVCHWRNFEGGPSPEGTGFVQVSSALGGHACALHESGSIWCGVPHFGPYYDDDRRANPPRGTFSSVTAGGSHTCGLSDSREVVCWGRNLYGQAEEPEGKYRAVSAGGVSTCALTESGEIVCWGAAHPAAQIPADLR